MGFSFLRSSHRRLSNSHRYLCAYKALFGRFLSLLCLFYFFLTPEITYFPKFAGVSTKNCIKIGKIFVIFNQKCNTLKPKIEKSKKFLSPFLASSYENQESRIEHYFRLKRAHSPNSRETVQFEI